MGEPGSRPSPLVLEVLVENLDLGRAQHGLEERIKAEVVRLGEGNLSGALEEGNVGDVGDGGAKWTSLRVAGHAASPGKSITSGKCDAQG